MEQPNGWAALIELIKVLAPLVAAVAAVMTLRVNRKQDPKLDMIQETAIKTEKLANGDRTAKEARIALLEKQLRAQGHEPHES